MFAVIRTGGKQYRVAAGDVIRVEKLAGTEGSAIQFSDVLAVGADGVMALGTSVVSGAKVSAEILSQTKGDKVLIFKKKRRHNYRRTRGHRQELTVLRITEIVAPDGRSAKAEPRAKPGKTAPERTEAAPAEAAAPKPAPSETAQPAQKTAPKTPKPDTAAADEKKPRARKGETKSKGSKSKDS